MVSYEQIEQANSKLSSVQLGKGDKVKDYVMVPQRVKAFRMLYPEGFILTDILSHENNVVLMQARAGYYNENGDPVVLGTGFAFEEKNKGMVNGTSYIENCETSAVGRALGFLALGVDGGGICSAEELVNAITAQNQNKQQGQAVNTQQKAEQNSAPKAQVTTGSTVPPIQQNALQAPQTPPPAPAKPPMSEGAAYLVAEKAKLEQELGTGFNFGKARLELIANGQVESVPSATITLPQAQTLIKVMRETYGKKAG